MEYLILGMVVTSLTAGWLIVSLVIGHCPRCRGTGIGSIIGTVYETKGIGIICPKCKGSGKHFPGFPLFVRKKRRNDVKTVQNTHAMFYRAEGVYPSVTYDEFIAGTLPPLQ